MKNTRKAIASTLLICFITNAWATNQFIENKGQLTSIDGTPTRNILFTAEAKGKTIFIAKDGFYFQSIIKQSEASATVECIKLQFVNVNDKVESIGLGEKPNYNNYYNSNGAFEHVKLFDSIYIKGIYTNVDLVCYFSKTGDFEYDFHVKSQDEIPQIKYVYLGVQNIHLNPAANCIKVETSQGYLLDKIPFSFCANNSQLLDLKYQVQNDTIEFRLNSNIKANNIIIDPVIYWGTYYGGSASDSINQVKTDIGEYVYVVGTTSSNSGIASLGAQQILLAGYSDAFIAKFDSSGNRLWGTYYGGSSFDYGRSIYLEDTSYIYLSGTTNSSAGIATTGTFMGTCNCSNGVSYYKGKGFLTKLDENGFRIWGTYYGDENAAYIASGGGVAVDKQGNAYVVGSETPYYTGFASQLATPGAYQTTWSNGATQEGFVFKFDSTGNRIWSTLYGHVIGNDVLVSVDIDSNGNVIACGGQYVVKFDSSGQFIWEEQFGEGFGGTVMNQVVCKGTNIYIAGSTDDQSNISHLGFQQFYGGGSSDAFCAELLSNAYVVWGTYYGGSNADYGQSVAVDSKGSVYLSGITSSSDPNVIGYGGYKSWSFSGLPNAFLVKFDSLGSRLWGTYYGNSSIGAGNNTCVAVSRLRNLYLAGSTLSLDSISTPGSYQPTFAGGANDGFIVRFDGVDDNLIFTSYNSGQALCHNTVYLIPYSSYGTFTPDSLTVELSNKYGNFNVYLSLGSITNLQAGNIPILIPDTVEPGNHYVLRITTVNPSMTLTIDSNVTIYPNVNAYTVPLGADSVCDSLLITAFPINATNYEWRKNSYFIGGVTSNYYTTTQTGQYNVIVTDSDGCKDTTANVNVTVIPNFNVGAITGNLIGIVDSLDSYFVNNISGTTYYWYVTGGSIVTGAGSSIITVKWLQPGNNSVTVYASNRCSDTSIVIANVNLQNPNGIVVLQAAESIKLYPDPATTQLFIETNPISLGQLNIYTITGSLVSQINLSNNNSVDISKLSSGIYIAEIIVNGDSVKRRFVKM